MITNEDVKRVVKGPADLEERIEQLEKQKEILKAACKRAGMRIKELEVDNKILVKFILPSPSNKPAMYALSVSFIFLKVFLDYVYLQ